MSDSSSWQCFSVQEFFSQSNWEGRQQKIDIEDIFQEISWLCLKIEEFFSHSNWQGELLATINRPSFSLTLPVSDFFQYFTWEVNPEIAPIAELKSIPEPDSLSHDDLKLNDFKNLF